MFPNLNWMSAVKKATTNIEKDKARSSGSAPREATSKQAKVPKKATESFEAIVRKRISAVETAERLGAEIKGRTPAMVSAFIRDARGQLPGVVSSLEVALRDRRVNVTELFNIAFALAKAANSHGESLGRLRGSIEVLKAALDRIGESLKDMADDIIEGASNHSHLVSTLVSLGIMPSGSTVSDFKNGAIFVKGYRFSASSVLLSFVMSRAMRLYHEDNNPLTSVIAMGDEALVPTGTRTVTGSGDLILDPKAGDMFCIGHEGNGPFPVGSVVVVGKRLSLGLPLRGVAKTGISAWLLSYRKLWLAAGAFLTETADDALSALASIGD